MDVNILVSSVGAKVGLLKAFRELPASERGKIVGIDSSPHVAGAFFCDVFHVVPCGEDASYWEAVEAIIEKEEISLVVPTREDELVAWRRWVEGREKGSVHVAVSSLDCLEICCDKWEAYQWMRKYDLPTPKTALVSSADSSFYQNDYPLIVKKRNGSGTREVREIYNSVQLDDYTDEWIVQPKCEGGEYTLNLYFDHYGICMCVIPHYRETVVEGEVNQAVTVKHPQLLELGYKLSECLDGAYGPLNFQVFWKGDDTLPLITDINPRFGGGYPLVHAAGGTFAHWLVHEVTGMPLKVDPDGWADGLRMVRFRESVFCPKSDS